MDDAAKLREKEREAEETLRKIKEERLKREERERELARPRDERLPIRRVCAWIATWLMTGWGNV
jgi:hypothetical protein